MENKPTLNLKKQKIDKYHDSYNKKKMISKYCKSTEIRYVKLLRWLTEQLTSVVRISVDENSPSTPTGLSTFTFTSHLAFAIRFLITFG